MVNLQGIIHSTLKYTVTNTTISLKVNAKECIIKCNTAFLIMAWFRPRPRGDEQCEYAFELDFHAKVVLKVRFSSLYNLRDLHIYLNPIVQASEKCRTLQSVTIVIFKKDLTAWYWLQLSKTVLVYVNPLQVDFEALAIDNKNNSQIKAQTHPMLQCQQYHKSSGPSKVPQPRLKRFICCVQPSIINSETGAEHYSSHN